MTTGVETILVEVAKSALQVFFANMILAGKTPEEISDVFDDELSEFTLNKPENLEDTFE